MTFIAEHTDPNRLDRVARLILFEEYRAHIRDAKNEVNILVIEDDPVSRKLIQQSLKDHEVEFCGNVFKAVDEYWRMVPDIVFLDIDLGNKTYNGLDVLDTVISYDRRSNIIILSGSDDPNNIEQALSHGAKGFISKPFSSDQLLECVKRYSKKTAGAICN